MQRPETETSSFLQGWQKSMQSSLKFNGHLFRNKLNRFFFLLAKYRNSVVFAI